MDKLNKIEQMIRDLAAQLSVPVQEAARMIVAAHAWTCYGDFIMWVLLGVVSVTFLVSGTWLIMKANEAAGARKDGEVPYAISGGLCLFFGFGCMIAFLVEFGELGNRLACVNEPVGHLLKSYIAK